MNIHMVKEIQPGWSAMATLKNEGGIIDVRKIRKIGHEEWSPAAISCANKVLNPGEALAFAQLMIEAARIAMMWDAAPPLKEEQAA